MSAQPSALFFACFPPPNTGQTLLTERFYTLSEGAVAAARMNIVDPGRHERTSGTFGAGRAASLLADLWGLRRRAARERPDILYITPAATDLGHLRDRATVAAARGNVGRIVAHIHNGDWLDRFEGRHARSARRLAAGIDTVILPTRSYAERAAAYFSPERVSIVPNTFDDDLMVSADEARAKVEARARRDRMRIVYISNMIPTKGYARLGEALGLLARRGVAFEADFAGGWPDAETRAAFEARLAADGIADRVRVHGSVTDRAEIRRLHLEADAFVLPTFYPHEFHPLSIVEALNAATPVVSTRHVTIPDMVTDGRGGILTEPRPEPLADALETLADVDRWARFARGARADFDAQFRTEDVRHAFVGALLGTRNLATP